MVPYGHEDLYVPGKKSTPAPPLFQLSIFSVLWRSLPLKNIFATLSQRKCQNSRSSANSTTNWSSTHKRNCSRRRRDPFFNKFSILSAFFIGYLLQKHHRHILSVVLKEFPIFGLAARERPCAPYRRHGASLFHDRREPQCYAYQ